VVLLEEHIERKLAAILAADVAGYTGARRATRTSLNSATRSAFFAFPTMQECSSRVVQRLLTAKERDERAVSHF